MSFTYIPDPTNPEIFEKLAIKDSRVFADGQPLLYGFMELDPVVEYLRKNAKKDEGMLFTPDMINRALNEIVKKL